MSEKVYPSRAGAGAGAGAGTGVGGAGYTKGQMYRAALPPYRPGAGAGSPPEKRRRRSSRGCCCCALAWLCSLLAVLVLLLAAASLVVWVVYRPQRPSFSVKSAQMSRFNVTRGGAVSYTLTMQLSARNPNKKVRLEYGDFDVKSAVVNGVDLAASTSSSSSLPGFVQGAKKTTVLNARVKGDKVSVSVSEAKKLQKAVAGNGKNQKASGSVETELVSNVRFRVGSVKSPRFRVGVHCDAVSLGVPKPSKSNTPCSLHFKLRVFKWYIG